MNSDDKIGWLSLIVALSITLGWLIAMVSIFLC